MTNLETSDSELRIQGVPIGAIADRYGTPFYVYDADILRETYRDLRDRLHPAVDIFLSLKANPNISVCGYLGVLGAGAEVSSLVELMTALQAGIAPRDIIFLGPGKSRAELAACVEAGIHAVVCESLEEVTLLDEVAAERKVGQVPALLRINPDFHTKGSGLAMGGKPRQFGIDQSLLLAAGATLAAAPRVAVKGLHAYMGTRFLGHDDIVHNTRQILATAAELARRLGIPLDTVDFGGGFGVAYFDNEKDLDLAALTTGINGVVEPFVAAHPEVRLINELGRYLTARAGTYVTRALYVKRSAGEEFVVADGGTNHHMAAVGIGSFVKRNFPIRSLTRYRDDAVRAYTVTGPLCTPNDVIGKRVPLPVVEPGDLLGVERSGAYGPSASPGLFLSHGYPAELLVHDGVAHLVRERDRPQDLLAKQRLADFISTPSHSADGRGSAMDRSDTVAAIGTALGEVLDHEVGPVAEDLRLFEDLHLDSTSVLELLMALEDALGVSVDPENLDMDDFRSVGTLADYVDSLRPTVAPSDAG
ncbi:phosphopantetheine-binding protein [Amycolatopsis coloradensis]|uniref:phosphopantetheine-binding protein n=1 Tax=Amycolatopsis coloradensis TaxID=76021 RepID=UPI001FC9EEE7|nr:phosphopantetheine-binding protein [Amycolatopsis coloradensis]